MNSGENKALLCLFEQTKVIAGFYLGYVVLDFLVQGIGNAVIREDTDFDCRDNSVIVPMNNSGATFLLIQTILLLSFTIMVLLVFYKIPDNFGLIAKKNKGFIKKFTASQSVAHLSFQPEKEHSSLNVEALLKTHIEDASMAEQKLRNSQALSVSRGRMNSSAISIRGNTTKVMSPTGMNSNNSVAF